MSDMNLYTEWDLNPQLLCLSDQRPHALSASGQVRDLKDTNVWNQQWIWVKLRNTMLVTPLFVRCISWYITCRRVDFPTCGRCYSRRRRCWGWHRSGSWTEPRTTATDLRPRSTTAPARGWLLQRWQTVAHTAWNTWNKRHYHQLNSESDQEELEGRRHVFKREQPKRFL